MNTYYAFSSLPVKFFASRSFLVFSCFWLLSGVMAAAQQQPPATESVPLSEPSARQTTDAILNADQPDTHATQEAPDELLIRAVRQPEVIIGKTLVLHDGVNAITVGPILDLRRRLQDQEIYLIVDAAAYFNSPVQYAVALKDVARMEEETLVIPEAPGMHLKGLDYYPDDYSDLDDGSSATSPVQEDN